MQQDGRIESFESMIVDGLRHIEGYTNDGVARQLGIYWDAVAKVPQRA